MTEQIQEISIQPQESIQPEQGPVLSKKKSGLKKIVIPACNALRSNAGRLLIVILFLAGGVYAGMQIEKKKVKVWTEPPFTEVTPEPTNSDIKIMTETIAPKSSGTVDETANWKTYNDSKGRFSIKHPPSYSIEEVEGVRIISSPCICGVNVSDFEGYKDYLINPVDIRIDYFNGKSVNEALNDVFGQNEIPEDFTVYLKDLPFRYIGGEKFLNTFKSAEMAFSINVYFSEISPKEVVVIYYKEPILVDQKCWQCYENVFGNKANIYKSIKNNLDQILSTFKFTNSSN